MVWDGYYRFGETEIINVPRTVARAKALGLHWVMDPRGRVPLAQVIGDTYEGPLASAAPWADPDVPEAERFAGLLTTNVTGVEDSTRTASVFEFTHDGGRPTGIRSKAKTVVFSTVLVAADDAALDYGFRWLKRVLLESGCHPGSVPGCRGSDLSYARTVPSLSHAAAGWDALERRLRDVTVTVGPRITGKRTFGADGCGGAVAMVSWTMVAADPAEYGPSVPVLRGMTRTYTAGESVYDPSVPASERLDNTAAVTIVACPAPVYTPIYDPDCPALISPPGPPNLKIGCLDVPGIGSTWNRRYARIPASLVPQWDEVRPVVTLTAGAEAVRNVRLRLIPGDVAADAQCEDVGVFYASYIPAGGTLTIDMSRSTAYIADGSGNARNADSLIFGDTNKPPVWFGLSCGEAYWIAMETRDTPDISLSLDLIPKVAA